MSILGATEEVVLIILQCGAMREVTVKDFEDQSAAIVEFMSRVCFDIIVLYQTEILQDDVLTALTKDKKRVEEAEIKVVMGWSSTLYVTNFPEGTRDDGLRALFEPVSVVDIHGPSCESLIVWYNF